MPAAWPAAAASVWRPGRLTDLVARGFVGALFVLLSINLLADFSRTHRFTGLLLLVSEALVVVLTIVRRPTDVVDRSAAAAIVAAVSMAGPPLFRAGGAAAIVPDAFTALLSAAGLSLVIAGKVALGRSFGIVPANRGVIAGGPYRLMRHPIYAGYLLTHVGFLLAHPRPANIALALIADAALVIRLFYEERVLSADGRYRAYCRLVAWHLVPGLF